eukprot:18978-Amphidinium_carterae.1
MVESTSQRLVVGNVSIQGQRSNLLKQSILAPVSVADGFSRPEETKQQVAIKPDLRSDGQLATWDTYKPW